METIRLMPLVVPGGWVVIKNHFGNEDPVIENGRILNEVCFNEDLLSIEKAVLKEDHWQNDEQGFCLDLGWLPEADPQGAYNLSFIAGNWDNMLYAAKSRDRHFVKRLIERCLFYGSTDLSHDKIRQHLQEEFGAERDKEG